MRLVSFVLDLLEEVVRQIVVLGEGHDVSASAGGLGGSVDRKGQDLQAIGSIADLQVLELFENSDGFLAGGQPVEEDDDATAVIAQRDLVAEEIANFEVVQ